MAHPQTNLEVTIEKLIYGGDGLARLDGQVALAPFVLPGERAVVEVVERKSGLLRSKLVEVREASRRSRGAAVPVFHALRRLPLSARGVSKRSWR